MSVQAPMQKMMPKLIGVSTAAMVVTAQMAAASAK